MIDWEALQDAVFNVACILGVIAGLIGLVAVLVWLAGI